ncbi:MAG: SDR family NAD(P)-dependent oxidoreductase [bacterium]|nr:SDR family NAD(P)-dependent oxidoreductase [bacterium]
MTQQTILITGAGSGIGKATAIALAQKEHRVIATTHSQADADDLTHLAQGNHWPIESFALDITIAKDREKILQYDLDVLINNAAIGETGSLAEIEIEKIKQTFEVNVFSTFALTQVALKPMMEKDRGKIIFISSLLGRVTAPFFGPYSMSKFALSSGAEMLHSEVAQVTKNVQVAIIEPGAYHTGFNQKMIAKKFVWMDEKSYFYSLIDTLKKKEKRQFSLTEQKDLSSIVNQVVRAVEAENPNLRSSAPWWQALGVRILRAAGK